MATISDLPNELLRIVFDCLPHRDKLSAGVVCRRWNDVLRAPHFQQERYYLLRNNHNTIAFLESATATESIAHWKNVDIIQTRRHPEHPSIIPIILRLVGSRRLTLRSLSIEFDPSYFNDSPHSSTDHEVFGTPLEGIEKLELILPSNDTELHSTHAKQFDWKLPEVERLEWMNYHSWNPFVFQVPHLRSLSFRVHNENEMTMLRSFAEQLTELTVIFPEDLKWIEDFFTISLPNVRRLSVKCSDPLADDSTLVNVTNGMRFVDAATNLTHIIFISKLFYNTVFAYACETLNNLEYVELQRFTVERKSFAANIGKIKSQNLELNILGVKGYDSEMMEPISIPSLRKLTCDLHAELFHHKCPNLARLYLFVNYNPFSDWENKFELKIAEVCRNYSNLQVLELFNIKLSNDACKNLSQLKNLRVLRFQNGTLETSCWRDCTVMPWVSRIIFACKFKHISDLSEIKEIFPGVKRLHFQGCHVDERSVRNLFRDAIVTFDKIIDEF